MSWRNIGCMYRVEVIEGLRGAEGGEGVGGEGVGEGVEGEGVEEKD